MKYLNLGVVFVGSFCVLEHTLAQESHRDIAQVLASTIEDVRAGRDVTMPVAQIVAADPDEVLEILRPFEFDPSANVRQFVHSLEWRVAMSDPTPRIHSEVTGRLVKACADPDALVWQHASMHLLSFEEADFSDASKEALRRLLRDNEPRPQFLRLAGVAGLRDQLSWLGSLLVDESIYETGRQSGRWYGTVSWAGRLARARLGVQQDVVRAVELVELERDPVIRVTVLLRDLGYIRQPAAIEAVRTYLNSEETLPQVKKGAPGTGYAQHAMDVLAENVPGFPVEKQYVGKYTEAEIRKARKWMRDRP